MKHLPPRILTRRPLSLSLFLTLCLDLVVAPLVLAAGGDALTRSQAWATGLLGLGTLTLSLYLFFVIFVPEKF